MKKMNSVVHFEMPAQDKNRMSDFYSNVFGWGIQKMGPKMNDYVVVTTTESDPQTGRPITPGAINGGFYMRDDNRPQEGPSFVIGVDDIHGHIKKITAAGGKILNEPHDIPGVGVYASFEDTEGNRVSLLQPAPMMTVHPK